jgi:hypothetical protein
VEHEGSVLLHSALLFPLNLLLEAGGAPILVFEGGVARAL